MKSLSFLQRGKHRRREELLVELSRGQEMGSGSKVEHFSPERSGVALKKCRREDSRGLLRENKAEEKV